MQLHQIKSIYKRKIKKRVGRGGKRGTYSGKGIKGQRSRAGRKLQPLMRELIKRYPKLRGYRQKLRRKPAVAVNLFLLEKKFETGEKITPLALFEKGLIGKIEGERSQVKILGKGEITKKLIVEGCEVSKSAKEKIERVGGIIK